MPLNQLLEIYNITPPRLNVVWWERYLQKYPDRELVTQILLSINEGFTLRYTGASVSSSSVSRSLPNEEFITIKREFEKEISLGRMAGPFDALPDMSPYSFLGISPSFVVPKKNSSEFRRIVNLSFAPDCSVNTGIDKHDFPVKYPNLTSVRNMLTGVPIGTRLSSRDIRKAYRQI